MPCKKRVAIWIIAAKIKITGVGATRVTTNQQTLENISNVSLQIEEDFIVQT